ncbi:hypothetical protein MY4038_007290, partial [Beauveria bassiana]
MATPAAYKHSDEYDDIGAVVQQHPQYADD